MRILVFSLYLSFLYSSFAGANVVLSSTYREAANIFQILDCSSGWWGDFCGDEGAYKRDFEARQKLSIEDHDAFKSYGNIRRRYYREDDSSADPAKNAFYGVQMDAQYTALFVWWPPIDRDYAYAVRDHLLLSKNPKRHLEWSDEDVVFHEVVHAISARQSLEQKRALTDLFLKDCPMKSSERRSNMLEEPLAVAIGQMLFLKSFDPKRFSKEGNWYRNPWVNRYAQALFPLVDKTFAKSGRLDRAFIQEAGKICKSLQ